MCKVIMIGCDLHDATMVLKGAVGSGSDFKKTFPTAQRSEMIAWMRELAAQEQAERICFVYEASGQGFGLRDDLCAAGIECHVLAPSHLPSGARSRRRRGGWGLGDPLRKGNERRREPRIRDETGQDASELRVV